MAGISLAGCANDEGSLGVDNPSLSTEAGDTDVTMDAESIDEGSILLDTAETLDEAIAQSGIGTFGLPDSVAVGDEAFTEPSVIEYADEMVSVTYQSEKVSLTITKEAAFLPTSEEGDADEMTMVSGDDLGGGETDSQPTPSWPLTSGGRSYRCYGETEGAPDLIEWTDEATGFSYSLACYSLDTGAAVLTNETAVALADQVS